MITNIIGFKIFFTFTILLLLNCFLGLCNINGNGLLSRLDWKVVDNMLTKVSGVLGFFWVISILNLIWGWL